LPARSISPSFNIRLFSSFIRPGACIAALSEVPTLTELGFAELVSNTWNILAAPPATPRAVLNKLNRAVDEMLQDNDVRTRFSKMETTVEGGSLDDARAYVAADRERWKKVIASAGIEAE
jgi:tripartite-type tricarboxylate transporter receptor subunit TctC